MNEPDPPYNEGDRVRHASGNYGYVLSCVPVKDDWSIRAKREDGQGLLAGLTELFERAYDETKI